MKFSIGRVTGILLVSLSLVVAGCSFSVSSGTVNTLKGKEDILVSADKPEPPPPPPKPKPKPIRKAKVVDKKIEISEKVMFEYNKAAIQEQSFDLLNDVAAVINENPKVELIQIEGHTDSDGKEKYNEELSQSRADAVMTYLVEAGVAESKLKAVGYGESKPIAENETDEGKEKNRRVEFNIKKQGK